MPKNDSTIKLPGYRVKKVSDVSPIVIEAEYTRKAVCLYCGCKKLRKKDTALPQLKGHFNPT